MAQEFFSISNEIPLFEVNESMFGPLSRLESLEPCAQYCGTDYNNFPGNIVSWKGDIYYCRMISRSSTSYSGGGPGEFTVNLYSPEKMRENGLGIICGNYKASYRGLFLEKIKECNS